VKTLSEFLDVKKKDANFQSGRCCAAFEPAVRRSGRKQEIGEDDGPVKPVGLEREIAAARTRADHQEIAAVYEQQAIVDKEAVERHRNLARAYERGWVWAPPRVGSVASAKRESQNLIAHCESLARLYQQAAEENLAMAREHRQVAAGTED
jgi:hypothetical protein